MATEIMNRTAALIVSFGTSHWDTMNKTIVAIEEDFRKKYGIETRRAFTSGMIMEKIARRDNIHIDNVNQALARLILDGYERVLIQPTHMINGDEYEKMMTMVNEFRSCFKGIEIGSPLLTESDDFHNVCKVIGEEVDVDEDEILVLMGHGTGHHSDAVYGAMDYRFKALGMENIFVGTVEGYPELSTVMELVEKICHRRKRKYRKVILFPFMVVAGEHAKIDMAGNEDSWKVEFENIGMEVKCILKGLGELKGIRDIYLSHGERAFEKLMEV